MEPPRNTDGDRHVGDATRLGLVEDAVEQEVGAAEERCARLHEEVEGRDVVEARLDGDLRSERSAPP